MTGASGGRYAAPGARPRVGVVLSGWPRVSETFALNELLALEAAGLLALVVATKAGDDALVQPGVALLRTPVRVLAAGDAEAQAAELAALAAGRVDALHGYFAHRPAEIAEIAAHALGVPFGFSAHALDVRKVDAGELRRRSLAAACVVACNRDTVASLAAAGAPVTMLAHGVDAVRFRPPSDGVAPADAADGAGDDRPLRLLAVGRLVAKKGFDVLVEAIGKVAVPVCLDIVGDGPERTHLDALVAAAGVGGVVRFTGRATHADLPARIAAADAVIVPSVIDAAGDRDGLPNVVLEAMACGRAIVASDVAAISQAVRHGVTGLLVPPGDPAALADAIGELADGERRRALGRSARALIDDDYELANCTARFVRELEVAYG